jgi:phosphate transport system permease protein
MVVAIAAGMMPNLTLNPIEPIQTLTAYCRSELGDVPHGTLEYKTIFAAGITSFMTLFLNILGFWFRRRIREVY